MEYILSRREIDQKIANLSKNILEVKNFDESFMDSASFIETLTDISYLESSILDIKPVSVFVAEQYSSNDVPIAWFNRDVNAIFFNKEFFCSPKSLTAEEKELSGITALSSIFHELRHVWQEKLDEKFSFGSINSENEKRAYQKNLAFAHKMEDYNLFKYEDAISEMDSRMYEHARMGVIISLIDNEEIKYKYAKTLYMEVDKEIQYIVCQSQVNSGKTILGSFIGTKKSMKESAGSLADKFGYSDKKKKELQSTADRICERLKKTYEKYVKFLMKLEEQSKVQVESYEQAHKKAKCKKEVDVFES